jgi:hypothetical protein
VFRAHQLPLTSHEQRVTRHEGWWLGVGPSALDIGRSTLSIRLPFFPPPLLCSPAPQPPCLRAPLPRLGSLTPCPGRP